MRESIFLFHLPSLVNTTQRIKSSSLALVYCRSFAAYTTLISGEIKYLSPFSVGFHCGVGASCRKTIECMLKALWAVVQEAGVQGCKHSPQKFWFVENPGNIPENMRKIWRKSWKSGQNSWKIWTKMAPNVVLLQKIAPNICRKTHEHHCFGGRTTKGLHDLRGRRKIAQKLFGQVWGNSGKNPLYPQTFACSYTYAVESMLAGINRLQKANG